MAKSALEHAAKSLNYGDLPETWRVPEVDRFSNNKTLYDYQVNALTAAARALFLYFVKARRYVPGESLHDDSERKRVFAEQYVEAEIADLTVREPLPGSDNEIFRILAEYIQPHHGAISYHNLINRMCFWMATGSGKTLVMIKLIEYLHSLQTHGEIPPHNVLVLAPSDYLLRQIERTIDEFNRAGRLQIDFLPLLESGRQARQGSLGDTMTVYFHRGDNIADTQSDALIDYRRYENDGKWYVLLDEAHKGSKDDSKRQAYYAIIARAGFLFNFSATFTDREDIATTVTKYNLEEFVENGYGKSIYLNQQQFAAFSSRAEEISPDERQMIVLKSLATLGYVSMSVSNIHRLTGRPELYHLPLMLTLVNSVNTDADERNDLWAFFKTLREIATGAIDEALFLRLKEELKREWRDGHLFFEDNALSLAGAGGDAILEAMQIADLRKTVFHSRNISEVQFIRSEDNRELAFQMVNADRPFALIRIGDTRKWRNDLLTGFEETTTLRESSFFADLEDSDIMILMGSRSFFESWDSNRPNVINFINIGSKDARKFVVQSVGRGLRIEPLPGMRRRLFHLQLSESEKALERYKDVVAPQETLFLFATNRNAVHSVLEGLQGEKAGKFAPLEGFAMASKPKIGGKDMPLLIPAYEKVESLQRSRFVMSRETLDRFKKWVSQTPSSVFAVRDGLALSKIAWLRDVSRQDNAISLDPDKNYAMLSFLQQRLLAHLARVEKKSDGVRELDNLDIVHFRHVRASAEHAEALQEKIERVRRGKASDEEIGKLGRQLEIGAITREEFDNQCAGTDEDTYRNNRMTIKNIARHYYLPVVLGDERENYIQHIINVRSEVDFVRILEHWLEENDVDWDAWMFSKIDETLDRVYIPYYDGRNNEYRQFMPDFVFWMCKGKDYRIVFVDPKSSSYTSSEHKLDGYRELFEKNGSTRVFSYGTFNVQVKLWMFNQPQQAPLQYRHYWTEQPKDIFAY